MKLCLGLLALALLHCHAAPIPANYTANPDFEIFNFALNLEFVEAEFYSHVIYGQSLDQRGVDISGVGTVGNVTLPAGFQKTNFSSPQLQQIINEIADNEINHVKYLKTALGSAAAARPAIDFNASFTAVAQAAGLIGANETWNPFLNETDVLLAAFLFEDVGVTAYKGAAKLLQQKSDLQSAAGILAVEAYQAGSVRLLLFERNFGNATVALSKVRDYLDGPVQDDQGVIDSNGDANIVLADSNSIAFSRTAQQVLDIVFGSTTTQPGGFLPSGLNAVNVTQLISG